MSENKDIKYNQDYVIEVDYESNRHILSDSLMSLAKRVKNEEKIAIETAKKLGYGDGVEVELTDTRKESIKLFIRNILKNTSDDDIRKEGANAIFKSTIIEIKKILLKYIDGKSEISSSQEVEELKEKLTTNISKISNNILLSYSDQETIELLDLVKIPKGEFRTQKVKFTFDDEIIEVNKNFEFDKNIVMDMLGIEKTLKLPAGEFHLKIKKTLLCRGWYMGVSSN